MFRSVAAALALLSVPAVAATPASQFDLKCAGTRTTKSMGTTSSEPYASVYRIDLDRKKWCEDECKALHDIASVQPAQLTLQNEDEDTPSGSSTLSNFIDRETGAHRILAASKMRRSPAMTVVLEWKGSCEPAAFSGFPDLKTKF